MVEPTLLPNPVPYNAPNAPTARHTSQTPFASNNQATHRRTDCVESRTCSRPPTAYPTSISGNAKPASNSR